MMTAAGPLRATPSKDASRVCISVEPRRWARSLPPPVPLATCRGHRPGSQSSQQASCRVTLRGLVPVPKAGAVLPPSRGQAAGQEASWTPAGSCGHGQG